MRHQDILKLQARLLSQTDDELMGMAKEIARDAGISMTDLFGHSHKPRHAQPRQFLMWRARQEGHTYESIGAFLSRDHTTIIHGVRQAQKRIDASQQETA